MSVFALYNLHGLFGDIFELADNRLVDASYTDCA